MRRGGLLLIGAVLSVATTACETNEFRAWRERVERLTALRAAVRDLAGSPEAAERAKALLATSTALRAELDVAAFVRERGGGATVHRGDDGVVTVTRRGTVPECEAVLAQLAPLRWRFEAWRLRLGPEGCTWQAKTGPALAAVEAALEAPPGRDWEPPPHSLFSFGVAELQRQTAALEADLRGEEAKLGPLAATPFLQAPVERALRALEARKRLPPPCDLAILRRELALDAPAQGRLLEVEHDRLVHPLEPLADLRLRGLVTRGDDGSLSWRCEAP